MTSNQDARPFVDLRKDAEEFRSKFDADILKCISFLDTKITTLICDPDSLGTPSRGVEQNDQVEFSDAKYDIFINVKSLINSVENEWLKYISEMKKLFIENVEIFLAGTKLEDKLPSDDFQSSPSFKKSPRKTNPASSITSTLYPIINTITKNVAAFGSPLRSNDAVQNRQSKGQMKDATFLSTMKVFEVFPQAGSSGTLLGIFGKNFPTGIEVFIGSNLVMAEVVSSKFIKICIPYLAECTYPVVLKLGKDEIAVGQFTWEMKSCCSVSTIKIFDVFPKNGILNSSFAIYGKNFLPDTLVFLGNTYADTYVLSDRIINVIVPALTSSTYDVFLKIGHAQIRAGVFRYGIVNQIGESDLLKRRCMQFNEGKKNECCFSMEVETVAMEPCFSSDDERPESRSSSLSQMLVAEEEVHQRDDDDTLSEIDYPEDESSTSEDASSQESASSKESGSSKDSS